VPRNLTRIVCWICLALIVPMLLLAGGLYLLSSWVPDDYHPQRLSEAQRNAVVSEFVASVVGDFGNKVRSDQAFEVSYSQEQVNRYLASMDAIAAMRPSVEHGTVYRMLDRAGLAEPAVSLNGGVLKVMIRSREYEKVISTGLTFDFAEDGSLKLGMSGAWIGEAPVPEAMIRDRLEVLKGVLEEQREKVTATTRKAKGIALVGFSTADIGRVLTAFITAIDEEPIPAEDLVSKIEGRRIRIESIKIADGHITLRFVPVTTPEDTDDGDNGAAAVTDVE